MSLTLSILAGIGLAAACGFRVFVPFLVMSVASLAGYMELSSGFAWIGTQPALIAFATATALEVAAYYVPWLDNLLDTVATPAAAIAGTLVMASFLTDMDPLVRWTLAVIAGGGAAGVIQGATTITRAASTLKTGGLANFALSTTEALLAAGLSVLALALPVVAALAALCVLSFFVFLAVSRLLKRKRSIN